MAIARNLLSCKYQAIMNGQSMVLSLSMVSKMSFPMLPISLGDLTQHLTRWFTYKIAHCQLAEIISSFRSILRCDIVRNLDVSFTMTLLYILLLVLIDSNSLNHQVLPILLIIFVWKWKSAINYIMINVIFLWPLDYILGWIAVFSTKNSLLRSVENPSQYLERENVQCSNIKL